jgi:hypothetical protein
MTVEVRLGIFPLEGNPLFLWGNCIAVVYESEYCIQREDTMRERRASYSGCVVGCISSFLLDNKIQGPENLSGGCSPH